MKGRRRANKVNCGHVTLALYLIALLILLLTALRHREPLPLAGFCIVSAAGGLFAVLRRAARAGSSIKWGKRIRRNKKQQTVLPAFVDEIEQNRDFLRCIAHEFQTPINSIQGFARLLQEDGLDEEERKRDIMIIIEEAQRLARLSDSLLLISRIENGQLVESPEPYSLDEQLRRVLAAMRPGWQEKCLRLEIELEPVRICGYEELLHEVWVNLIGNAVKFCSEDGVLRVLLKHTENEVCVEVFNDGPQIPQEEAEHIFELFYQTGEGKKRRGSGLGLAIANRIVTISGGTIGVRAARGGTAFVVKLPFAGAGAYKTEQLAILK